MLILSMLLACTKPKHAITVLEGQGYSDIKITGYRWTGCSEDDKYQTGFRAKGKDGKYLTGVVCEGLFLKAQL